MEITELQLHTEAADFKSRTLQFGTEMSTTYQDREILIAGYQLISFALNNMVPQLSDGRSTDDVEIFRTFLEAFFQPDIFEHYQYICDIAAEVLDHDLGIRIEKEINQMYEIEGIDTAPTDNYRVNFKRYVLAFIDKEANVRRL